MKALLQRFINNGDDAVIIIECECGNQHMWDCADSSLRKEIFVYRRGVSIKRMRCVAPNDGLSPLRRQRQPACERSYRVSLNPGSPPPSFQVAQLTPGSDDQAVNPQIIFFPLRRD